MGLLAAVEQIQRMGHKARQAETDHDEAADSAAPQQPPQLQRQSDKVACQKADNGHMEHEKLVAQDSPGESTIP